MNIFCWINLIIISFIFSLYIYKLFNRIRYFNEYIPREIDYSTDYKRKSIESISSIIMRIKNIYGEVNLYDLAVVLENEIKYINFLNNREYSNFESKLEALKTRITELEITTLIKEKENVSPTIHN